MVWLHWTFRGAVRVTGCCENAVNIQVWLGGVTGYTEEAVKNQGVTGCCEAMVDIQGCSGGDPLGAMKMQRTFRCVVVSVFGCIEDAGKAQVQWVP